MYTGTVKRYLKYDTVFVTRETHQYQYKLFIFLDHGLFYFLKGDKRILKVEKQSHNKVHLMTDVQ